jgi:hypothetical protein
LHLSINDSGSPDGAGKEYALSRFVDAWEDSGFFYVSTDHPPANLQQLASGFDPEEGVFPEMTSFMAKHALQDAEHYVDLMRDSFPAGMSDAEIARALKEVQRAGGDLDEIHKCDLLVEKILKHPYDPQGYLDDLHSDPRTKDVVYRAGTCHHCGGYGYTTWPSSGSRERCWFCDGSGVAM